MTIKISFVFFLSGFFLFSFFSGASAQSGDDRWRALADIKPGTRIVVDLDGREPLKVKFAGTADQTLAVLSKGTRTEIDRSAIAAVYRGRKSSKVKGGLIGGLAGAGAGLLISAVAIAATKGDPLIGAGAFLIGIPVGAAIGVATAGGTKKGDLLYVR